MILCTLTPPSPIKGEGDFFNSNRLIFKFVSPAQAGISIFGFRISIFHYPAPVGKDFLLEIF